MPIIIRQLATKAFLLFSRGPTIPASCYDTCNSAYLAAQQVGKTESLCASNSTFRTYLQACETCVQGVDATAVQDDLDPTFGQYISYCAAVNTIPTTPTATGDSSSISDSISYEIVQTVLPHTVSANGGFTTWLFTTNITSYANIPATSVVAIPTIVNGQLTTFTFTTTYAQLPSDLLPTTSALSIPTPTNSTEPTTSPSRGWIAGPIVGGLSGVLIIVSGVFFMMRYRQRRLKKRVEAELGGNPIANPKPDELDAPNRPQELDALGPRTMGNSRSNVTHELAADG
ncbi:hypothetical protein F4804DRAFT_311269 [Jackrogersella minutella]|nr:hypothetical protein F4804DRAFT_311269 [Jackrogersella minutella]